MYGVPVTHRVLVTGDEAGVKHANSNPTLGAHPSLWARKVTALCLGPLLLLLFSIAFALK